MPSPVNVTVKETEVVKLVLDFLHTRELYLSMRSLERESGIVNGLFSEDALFLRQLILDGQWDDVLEFIQPLQSIESFDSKAFQYLILKHKFLEMLCMKSEDFQHLQVEFSSEEVVSCLSELEPYCPSKEEYSGYCLLLTLPRLTDHQMYKDWSPSSARVQCFQSVYPLVCRFLPVDKALAENESTASNDRLVQLILKGLLFENCVEYCQQKAINRDAKSSQIVLRNMMTGTPTDDADLSLLSWLQSLPFDTFATPFEQRSLQISVSKIIKPSTSFSEQIMTPMTPTPGSKTRMYPSPSPSTPTLYRGRPFSSSSRALSQSLTPNLESLLNQAKKKEDNGTSDPGMLSRSLINMQLSGSSSARESLPTLTEGVEKPSGAPFSISIPSPSPSIPARFNQGSAGANAKQPEVRNSSAAAYEDFRQDRERAQRELQEREQRRKQLEEELIGGGGSTVPAATAPPATAPAVQGATQGNGVTSPPLAGTITRQEGIKIWNPTCHAISSLEDVQAIRAVTFDPTGSFYAVGSNSKTLRICVYPEMPESSGGGSIQQPKVLFKRMRHHKGSIYCVAWSHTGNLVATGSNDKLIKLVRFDPDKCNASGPDVDLSFHDGTVRDLVFQKDSPSGTTLISAGAGDCSIYLTDCQQGQPVHAMAGHTGHVLSLYTWSGHMLASGSQDNTVRLWDVRTPRCIQIIGSPGSDSGEGSGAAAVAVDPSGRLLASGHEDSSIMLYDIHGGRPLQTFKSHSSDIRSLRFSPRNFYLMSGSYDCTIKLANLQADITQAVPSATIAEHRDKVIQCRWHPSELSFLTSSADRTVTLWAMDNP